MTSATHDLSCHTGAPSAARRWTAECLRAYLGDRPPVPDLIEDAVLCVSEFVTNAVRAGCTKLRVELSIEDDGMRVGVLDDAPGRPALRRVGTSERSGRGLSLVEAVSRRWGVDMVERGKLVWAEFATTG